MSVNNTSGQESDGSLNEEPETRTVSVPIPVPAEIERVARGRRDLAEAQGLDFDFDDPNIQLEAYLKDYIEIDPVFLTRDHQHPEYEEFLTHALYTCVSEDHHELVKAEVDRRSDVTSIQEFVRKAVTNELGLTGNLGEYVPVDDFSRHERAVYKIVASAHEISPGEIYGRYCKKVDVPRSESTVRSYLRELEDEGLVTSEGEARGKRYKSPNIV